jgi:transcriptional regulator PpsR
LPNADLGALSALAPELASTVASLAGDIALVVDAQGVVRNVAVGEAALGASADSWIGRPWADTVTDDTRRKIEDLLSEVQLSGRSRRREVNHPSAAGLDIPVAWAAVRLGDTGPVLAVGRDLRAVAAIQQRFLESQQELERDYWKRRQTEARYRLLFQVATDAVLVLDADTHHILEANRAAGQMFGQPADRLVGLPANDTIEAASRPALEQLLINARSTGRAGEIRVRVNDRSGAVEISATPFRTDQNLLLLVRARVAGPTETQTLLAEVVEHARESVVVTDIAGRVLAANPAFLTLTHQSAVEGKDLGDLLGDHGDRLRTLIADARRHGIAARMVLARDGQAPIEASAMLLPEGDQERIGFSLRPAEGRSAPALGPAADLAAAIEHLTEQVGQRPLPHLMREAMALAERHLIDAALAEHGVDHDAAAAALGLSRENLELRMSRLGLVPGRTGMPTAVT